MERLKGKLSLSLPGLKVKDYILHKRKKTVSESKEIATASDGSVSSGECEAE